MTRCFSFLNQDDFNKISKIITRSLCTHEHYKQYKKLIQDNSHVIDGEIEDGLDTAYGYIIDKIDEIIEYDE